MNYHKYIGNKQFFQYILQNLQIKSCFFCTHFTSFLTIYNKLIFVLPTQTNIDIIKTLTDKGFIYYEKQ